MCSCARTSLRVFTVLEGRALTAMSSDDVNGDMFDLDL